MIPNRPDIRLMAETDLLTVLAIQHACYAEQFRESGASLHAKLLASPTTCVIASLNGEGVGYLFAVPCESISPPAWNARMCQLPAVPDCLYLHDLAVRPDARNSGTGRALVEMFMALLRESGLGSASLVSVQNSVSYWERHGFRPVSHPEALRAKLATYGDGAVFMERAA